MKSVLQRQKLGMNDYILVRFQGVLFIKCQRAMLVSRLPSENEQKPVYFQTLECPSQRQIKVVCIEQWTKTSIY